MRLESFDAGEHGTTVSRQEATLGWPLPLRLRLILPVDGDDLPAAYHDDECAPKCESKRTHQQVHHCVPPMRQDRDLLPHLHLRGSQCNTGPDKTREAVG